ncbi:MAG: hypothetical protein Q9227_001639 [Pyrenula ochraceoflavens]
MAFLLGFIVGLLFIPAALVTFLLYAYLTLPFANSSSKTDGLASSQEFLQRPGDDEDAFRTTTDKLASEFQRKHDSDVAAGYFAVCREYIPGGLNGKPPEKVTPAGEVVPVEPSLSVYQSMYRSIFDRREKPTIEPSKGNGKPVKRARNVFYVVLRYANILSSSSIFSTDLFSHGHLMLYEDDAQMEVRHVISLEHHDVDIFAGNEERIPEGELWIRRNAIRLTRKAKYIKETGADPPPFFLFSRNTSEQEDFYHAMLKNQENLLDGDTRPPSAQQFEIKHIISLVQRLHSSEENLQTRWINAFLGRIFLALYKTREVEEFLRRKIAKKISRVQKPSFITRLALHRISAGEGAPFITQPRLKDLTVSGETCVEADVEYSGHFQVEISATARIDLGSRFKARDVDLMLAVVVKTLKGHVLFRMKPPPSNRIWFSFEKMPSIDLDIQPIVSSRQVAYSILIRTIENRIREVVAETLVVPNWDDVPFLDTLGQRYRGGIWKQDEEVSKPTEIQQQDPEDESQTEKAGEALLPAHEKEHVLSTQSVPSSPLPDGLKARGSSKTYKSSTLPSAEASTTSVDKAARPSLPKAIRSQSFSSAANPQVTTNHVSAQSEVDASPRKDAASTMIEISSRSLANSTPGTPTGSPPKDSTVSETMNDVEGSLQTTPSVSTTTSHARQSSMPSSSNPTPIHSRHASIASTALSSSNPPAPSSPSASALSFSSSPSSDIVSPPKRTSTIANTLKSVDRQALTSAATAAARKWSSWNMLNRNPSDASTAARPGTPDQPMGRGRPLPPPGVPLPPPEKKKSTSGAGSGWVKRKPVPPAVPERNGTTATTSLNTDEKTNNLLQQNGITGSTKEKPPLPERRKQKATRQSLSSRSNLNLSHDDLLSDTPVDEVMVVQAPKESAPNSPVVEEPAGQGEAEGFFGEMEGKEWGANAEREDVVGGENEQAPTQMLDNVGRGDLETEENAKIPTRVHTPPPTQTNAPPPLPPRSSERPGIGLGIDSKVSKEGTEGESPTTPADQTNSATETSA